MAVIHWNKKYGETLLITLERFRSTHPEFQDAKITYAGRLDPLAEGLMILLTDEDVHHKDRYNKLSKTYEVDFLFGVSSDTYDALGILKETKDPKPFPHKKDLSSFVGSLAGVQEQEYPPYSSKTIKGKSLWQYAREDQLDGIIFPKESREVFSAELVSHRELKRGELISEYLSVIDFIEGDFRQEEIKSHWERYLDERPDNRYTVFTARFGVSSGTYIRSLVHSIGEHYGCGALSLRIKRTQIAEHQL
ncbi:MAG: hypothetical protein PHC89_02400 [Candidatus Pacebacteria bacterium]|nr:hypothetical protein [Candidatus Paceibacterota bacterium]